MAAQGSQASSDPGDLQLSNELGTAFSPHLAPLVLRPLLPDDDAVVKRAGGQQRSELWVSPANLPHRALVASQVC